MGCARCRVLYQYTPTREVELFEQESQRIVAKFEPTSGLDKAYECNPQLDDKAKQDQRLVHIDTSEDLHLPIRSDSSRGDQTVERLGSTKLSPTPFPKQFRRDSNSASGGSLAVWKLCRDTTVGLLEPIERPTSNKVSHNLSSEQSSSVTLQELSDERDSHINTLLKDGPYGICKVTGANSLDKCELEYITNGTGIAEVYEMFEDCDGSTIWFKDSQGRLFEWCRMGGYLRYMGPNMVEGIKTLIERPKSILVWVDGCGRWENEEEFNHRMAQEYKRTVAKCTKKLPGETFQVNGRWVTKFT